MTERTWIDDLRDRAEGNPFLGLFFNEGGDLEVTDHTITEVKIATINGNFNNDNNDPLVTKRLAERGYSAIFGQEWRDTNAEHTKPRGWSAHQDRQTNAMAGCAFFWDPERFVRLGGGIRLGVDPRMHPAVDSDIQARFILWSDFRVRRTPHRFRFVDIHLPPKRDWELAPHMANAVVRVCQRSPYPLIIGGDMNHHMPGDKWGIAKRLRLNSHGDHIDGFHTDRRIRVTHTESIPVGSDHNAVGISLKLVG